MDSSPPFSDLSVFNHVINELIEVLIMENTVKSIKARIKNLIMYLEGQQVTHLEERTQRIQHKLDVLSGTHNRKNMSDVPNLKRKNHQNKEVKHNEECKVETIEPDEMSSEDSKKDDGGPSKSEVDTKSLELLNNLNEMGQTSDEQISKTLTNDADTTDTLLARNGPEVDNCGTSQYSGDVQDDQIELITNGGVNSEDNGAESKKECSLPSDITEMVKKENDLTNNNFDDQIVVQLEVDTTDYNPSQSDWEAMSEPEEPLKKSFVCPVCSKPFTRKDSLKRHKAVHNRITFKCNSCSKECLSKIAMETHTCSETARNEQIKDQRNDQTKTDESKEDLNECPICNEEFVSKAGMKRHLLLLHSVKSFSHVKCKKCQQQFETVKAFKNHLENHCFWKSDSDNNKSCENFYEIVQKKKKEFKCLLCFKVFLRRDLLIAHEYVHTGQSPYKCEICGRGFSFKYCLTKHIQTHSENKPFNCGFCHKSFRRQLDVNLHMRIHSEHRPFKCDKCEKGFKAKYALMRHIRCIHVDFKPFMCDICGESCFDKHTLRRHLRKHSDKPAEKLTCEICSKQFSKRYLRFHMDLHKDQRSYLCTECGESFRSMNYLRMHKYSHMTEKPKKCSICSKSFATKHKLEVHENVHAGRKPYQCEVCGKGSADKSNYYKHKKIHQNK